MHAAVNQVWPSLHQLGLLIQRASSWTAVIYVWCPQVESLNLAGLDRVLVAYAAGTTDRSLLLRQYRVAFKKSGTKVCCTS